MSDAARLVLLVALAAWMGACLFGQLHFRVLHRRLGRDGAWPLLRRRIPMLDLFGTWAGAIASLVLLLGRRRFSLAWAGALGLVAVMVTASLYDRAVLMPSLEAAGKRLGAAASSDTAQWESDWRFLWRMSAWSRWGTLLAGAAAFACGLSA